MRFDGTSPRGGRSAAGTIELSDRADHYNHLDGLAPVVLAWAALRQRNVKSSPTWLVLGVEPDVAVGTSPEADSPIRFFPARKI